MVSAVYAAITFSDGTTVSVPPSGVVLLVGPNNAGKSQTLRDLVGLSGQQGAYVGRAVTGLEIAKDGTADDFAHWLQHNLQSINDRGRVQYNVPGWAATDMLSVRSQWEQPTLGVLLQLFVYHADAASRLTAGNSAANVDFSTSFASHPIQRAYRNADLEHDIDRISRDAFGLGITVDRFSGAVITLRAGEPPEFSHDRGVPTSDYLAQLQALPRLEDQGDGVRSYVGLLLHILAGTHQVTLVDEPEAFLHPPQARRLGQVLAERTAGSQQVFMATHSSDVVQGALDSAAEVTIIRITRSRDTNSASVLDSKSVRALWSDPLLRYSNVLDGLFHDAVVLCESDSDCRYYSSVLDELVEEGKAEPVEKSVRRPQILFTHCGGKARLATVVASLRAASVPVVVVADFDLLKEAATVARLVEALGGNFDDVREDLNIVSSALTSEVRPVSKLGLKEELNRALDNFSGATIDKSNMERLRALMRAESGWDRAKRSGIEAVPQGDPSRGILTTLAKLVEVGLLVVPVGELERFVPTVSGHGPSWVTEVLRQGLHKVPNQAASEFVKRIEKTVISVMENREA